MSSWGQEFCSILKIQLFVYGEFWPTGKKAEGQENNSVGSHTPWGSGRASSGEGKIWKGQHTPGVAILWLREILTLHTPGYRWEMSKLEEFSVYLKIAYVLFFFWKNNKILNKIVCRHLFRGRGMKNKGKYLQRDWTWGDWRVMQNLLSWRP